MMSINKFPTHRPQIFYLSSLLSLSSISTSSSCSRFPSAIDDGLGRPGSLKVQFAHRNSISPFKIFWDF